MEKLDFLRLAFGKSQNPGLMGPERRVSGVPAVSPFVDCDYWYMLRILNWSPDSPEATVPSKVKVPKGFVTDFASVPQVFWNIIPPIGRYTVAAIMHDYLYWFQPCERDEADNALKVCMREMAVSNIHVATIYGAVRAAGSSAWNDNATRKKAGEKRVLRKFPDDPLISWKSWKQLDVFA